MIELDQLVNDVARAIELADSRRPEAARSRTGREYQPGLGPHTEAQTIKLVVGEVIGLDPEYALSRCHPAALRLVPWVVAGLGWAIEVKLLRLFGDNGKLNDDMVMHILSPCTAHRSALTDAEKLARSSFDARRAIMIVGYDYDKWEMDPAIGGRRASQTPRWPPAERLALRARIDRVEGRACNQPGGYWIAVAAPEAV